MTTQKNISYRLPQEARDNVAQGESLKKRWGRGGSDAFAASIKGASAGLANCGALSLGAVQELSNYFEQHPDSFKPTELEKDEGPNEQTINWLLAGGTAAKKWSEKIMSKHEGEDFTADGKICKVDESLGLVFGWAIICKEDGKDYFDSQSDHIPEDAMLKAAADFMQGARVVGDMHEKAEGGQVVFAFPMTEEVAKAFGITTKNSGLMIAIKPADQKTLEKFKDGTYNGFSIGGKRGVDETVGGANA